MSERVFARLLLKKFHSPGLQHALVEKAGSCLARDMSASKPAVFPVNWIVPDCNLYKQPDRRCVCRRVKSFGRGFVNLNALVASTRGDRTCLCVCMCVCVYTYDDDEEEEDDGGDEFRFCREMREGERRKRRTRDDSRANTR